MTQIRKDQAISSWLFLFYFNSKLQCIDHFFQIAQILKKVPCSLPYSQPAADEQSHRNLSRLCQPPIYVGVQDEAQINIIKGNSDATLGTDKRNQAKHTGHCLRMSYFRKQTRNPMIACKTARHRTRGSNLEDLHPMVKHWTYATQESKTYSIIIFAIIRINKQVLK